MDPDFQTNQPGQVQQPGVQTGSAYQPENTPQPQGSLPPQPPEQASYGGADYPTPSGNERTKKLLIVIAALVGLFIIIAIVALAFKNGGDKPAQQAQQNVTGDFYVKEPSAVDVESVNNSISDDISGLDTDADFPKDNLNDFNLGL